MIGFIMMLLFKKMPFKKGFWACRRKKQAPSGCRFKSSLRCGLYACIPHAHINQKPNKKVNNL
jgi:hypothetical protein